MAHQIPDHSKIIKQRGGINKRYGKSIRDTPIYYSDGFIPDKRNHSNNFLLLLPEYHHSKENQQSRHSNYRSKYSKIISMLCIESHFGISIDSSFDSSG